MRKRLVLVIGLMICLTTDLLTGSVIEAASVSPQIQNVAAEPSRQSENRIPDYASPPVNAALTMTPATAQDLALAMGINTNDVVSANISNSDPLGTGVRSSALSYFPTQGTSFAILSTGLVTSADTPNQAGGLSYELGGLNNSQGNDLVQLTLRLRVPNDKNCMRIDFAYYSEEFPEFVGSQFNDTFTAEFNGTNLSISGNEVVAPLNFAFDTSGSIISVNTVAGVTGNTGTTYDGTTPLLTAKQGVPPGQTVTLIFSVQDLGDSIYDSAVFLDNFQWVSDSNCQSGGQSKPPLLVVHGIQTLDFKNGGHQCTNEPVHLLPGVGVTNLGDLPQWFLNDYDVWLAFLDSSPLHTPSLEKNAECLRRQVNYVYSKNNKSITLMAHSMGGLVSRGCLFFSDCRDKVETLYTLGSPHGGLNWELVGKALLKLAEKYLYSHGIPIPVGEGLCLWQTALCEMGTDQMVWFNYTHPNQSDLTYIFIGGEATPAWPGWLLFPTDGKNDGAVSSKSAIGWSPLPLVQWYLPPGWPNASPPHQYWTDEVHVPDFSGHAYFMNRASGGYEGKSQAYGCIQYQLGKITRPNYCKNPQTVQSAVIEPVVRPLSQSTMSVDGNVLHGQEVAHTVMVDTNQTSIFFLSWTEGDIQFRLIRPDNQVVDANYALAHPNEVAYEYSGDSLEFTPYATYTFSNTLPGSWKFVITGNDVGSVGAGYVGFAALETSRVFSVTHDANAYNIGDTAILTATLQRQNYGIPGATIKATLYRTDGVTETVTFSESGGGRYRAQYTLPNAAGVLPVEVVATGDDGGRSFTRQTNFVLTITPNEAQLTGAFSTQPRNENSDALYETLDFEVNIAATAFANYVVSADLAANGQLVTSNATNISLSPGTHPVVLQFDGNSIRAQQLDGPYVISRLSLINTDLGVPAQSIENAWTTAPYHWQDFGSCYTLTLVNNPPFGGAIHANPPPNCNNGTQYSVDTEVELTAVPNSDYIFINWIADASGTSNPIKVSVDTNKTVAANFLEITWGAPTVITMTVDPSEIVANGNSISTIMVTVMDASGNVVPAQNVTFDTTLGTLSTLNAPTNSAGVTTVALTSATTDGTAVVTAKAGAATGTIQVKFTATHIAGDCNADQSIGAADITALALEFFDGDDNNNPAATSGGTYAGNPGCDANQDSRIGASDITCVALIFFNGPGACTVSTSTGTSTGPLLSIADQLPAPPGGQVMVPIVLQTNNSDVSSLLFSLDYDETWLTFDPTDGNQDGIPDAVTFNVPEQYVRSVTFDPSDTDGELDVMIGNFASPSLPLADGALLSVMLTAGAPTADTEAAVNFAQTPVASFGDTKGHDVPGATENGSILLTATEPATPQSTIYLPFVSQNR